MAPQFIDVYSTGPPARSLPRPVPRIAEGEDRTDNARDGEDRVKGDEDLAPQSKCMERGASTVLLPKRVCDHDFAVTIVIV